MKKEMRKLKTYQDVQDTYQERKNDRDFDYYYNNDVCIIHVKFGRARKLYCGLTTDNYLTHEFIDEYLKYWDGDITGKFQTARDVVDYIVEHNLPVILYGNLFDKELNKEEIYEWLKVNNDEEDYKKVVLEK